jgi:hypothetical protein
LLGDELGGVSHLRNRSTSRAPGEWSLTTVAADVFMCHHRGNVLSTMFTPHNAAQS